MPLPLAPFAAALLGVVFGLVGRDEVRRTSAPPSSTRGFLVVTLVSLLLLAPAVGYFVAFYPDWSYAYFVAGERVPSAVELVAVLLICALGPLAYAWTATLLRRHAVRELVRGISALVVLLAASFAFIGPRLLVAATYGGFRDGIDVRPVGSSPLGVSILLIDGCLIAGVAWAASRLRAIGRA